MNGLYCLNGIVFPYYDTASPVEKEWWDSFKNKFDYEPNTGAAYGYIVADLFIEAIERAGQDLNIDSFVSAMESIVDYVDPLETSTVSFSETSRQGSNVSYFFQVKDERFEVISGPISY